jgi:hypothetical protein
MHLKHMLLHIFCPEVELAYLLGMVDDVARKLQAVVTDNGADALVAAGFIRSEWIKQFGPDGFGSECLIRCIY